uniref:Uncharacterized protein n=1 Tax=Nelumbo nucifera TaxID=4432 RepID=A0A822YJ33_NELNU|nr:TPA_asm: hypothetical protein HUJ06_010373 [Nelumbo nucifera]
MSQANESKVHRPHLSTKLKKAVGKHEKILLISSAFSSPLQDPIFTSSNKDQRT